MTVTVAVAVIDTSAFVDDSPVHATYAVPAGVVWPPVVWAPPSRPIVAASAPSTAPATPAAVTLPILTPAELASQRDRRTAGLLGTHETGTSRGGAGHRLAAGGTFGTVSSAGEGARASKSSVEALADVNRHIEIATLIINGLTTPRAIARHLDAIGRPLSPRQIERVTNSDGFLEIYNRMLERKFERLNDEMADETANPYKRMHAAEVRSMTLLVEALEELRARVKGTTTVTRANPVTGATEPAFPARAPTPTELHVAVMTASRVLKMGPNAGRYARAGSDESSMVAFVPTPEQSRVLLEADGETWGAGAGAGAASGDIVDLVAQRTRVTPATDEAADAAAVLAAGVERYREHTGAHPR